MSAIVKITMIMEPVEGAAFDFTDSGETLAEKIEMELTLIAAEHESIFAQARGIEVEVER